MKITYTYKILNVNEESKTMEVLYKSEKYGEMTVFTHTPRNNETLESVIKQYSPVYYWADKDCTRKEVKVGQKGEQTIEFSHPDEYVEEEQEINLNVIERLVNDHDRRKVVIVLKELGLLP